MTGRRYKLQDGLPMVNPWLDLGFFWATGHQYASGVRILVM